MLGPTGSIPGAVAGSERKMIEVIRQDAFFVLGLPIQASWDALPRHAAAAWEQVLAVEEFLAPAARGTYVRITLGVEQGVYHEFVGVRVDGDIAVPAGLQRFAMPAQRYVRKRHYGRMVDVLDGFIDLYRFAKNHALGAQDLRIDMGYLAGPDGGFHELLVAIEPQLAPVLQGPTVEPSSEIG